MTHIESQHLIKESTVAKPLSIISNVAKPVKRIACQQCDYKAMDEKEFENHTTEMHSESATTIVDDHQNYINDSAESQPVKKQKLTTVAAAVSSFSCKRCSFHTDNKQEVVLHFKEQHVAKPKRKNVDTQPQYDSPRPTSPITEPNSTQEIAYNILQIKNEKLDTNNEKMDNNKEKMDTSDGNEVPDNVTRKMLLCPHCTFKTPYGGKFQTHLFNKHPENSSPEPLTLETETSMVSSPELQMSNDATPTATSESTVLNENQKYNRKSKNIQCKLCSFKTSSGNKLRIHMSRAHKKLPKLKDFEKILPNVSDSELKLPEMDTSYFDKTAKVCTICSSKFNTPAVLWVHMASLHFKDKMKLLYGKEGFECGQCNKQFKVESGLLYHLVRQHNALNNIFENLRKNQGQHLVQNSDVANNMDKGASNVDETDNEAPQDEDKTMGPIALENQHEENGLNNFLDPRVQNVDENNLESISKCNKEDIINELEQSESTDQNSNAQREKVYLMEISVMAIKICNSCQFQAADIKALADHLKTCSKTPSKTDALHPESSTNNLQLIQNCDPSKQNQKQNKATRINKKYKINSPKSAIATPQTEKEEIKISPTKTILFCSQCKFKSEESIKLSEHIAKKHSKSVAIQKNKEQNTKQVKSINTSANQDQNLSNINTTLQCSKCEKYTSTTLKELALHYRSCATTVNEGTDKEHTDQEDEDNTSSIKDHHSNVPTEQIPSGDVTKELPLDNKAKDDVKSSNPSKYCPNCGFTAAKLTLLAMHFVSCSKNQSNNTSLEKGETASCETTIEQNNVTPYDANSKSQCSLCSFTSMSKKDLSIHFSECYAQWKLSRNQS